MLIPGVLYGLLAGYHYWFPKAFGFRLNEAWGRIAWGSWVVGFYLTFMPLYVLGLGGMARRSQELFQPEFRPWLLVAASGALVLLFALAALVIQFWISIRDRAQNRVFVGDPWDGRGLEWSVSAPPPHYNFAVIPVIHGRDPFFDGKRAGTVYQRPVRYQDIELPASSAVGVVIGASATAAAFGLVWHIGWLAVVGVTAIWSAVIWRSFKRDTHRIIPAREVEIVESHWLHALAIAVPIPRQQETMSVNRGLAKLPT